MPATTKNTPNRLQHETSPYLLQHADNPVNWYPWCEEAFEKAKAEDKPIFLSIGYSTCHWCHVMAHESFADAETAAILNQHFVSIKVDREERPDIDSIYMTVCQAFTGSGGWPMSIFMTAAQQPFFAGTYFPKDSRYGMIGFSALLTNIHTQWTTNREALLVAANEVVSQLQKITAQAGSQQPDADLPELAVRQLQQSFDEAYGGFGAAPKFPTPHNLLFLMQQYEKNGDTTALHMAEVTLRQLYRGGIFDHIGYGFSRYSTDRSFLVPHFEKMLYDNALLILSYTRAYHITKDSFYLEVAQKTAAYILRELTSPQGGFYSAQDADSDGEEGKYYVFTPAEITALLGEKAGSQFNKYFHITESGNFEGKSIPNLLGNDALHDAFLPCLMRILHYRKKRAALHLDDKILTAWNALMLAAMAALYRASGDKLYLDVAKRNQQFIETKLCRGNQLFVSFRNGQHSGNGFLDDYAFYGFALLSLYDATLDEAYMQRAQQLCNEALRQFYDYDNSGFFLSGTENEALLLRPKEVYDGAIPSGNAVMAYNLVRLAQLSEDTTLAKYADEQLAFLSGAAKAYPSGHCFFLMALSDYLNPPPKITVVPKESLDVPALLQSLSPDCVVRIQKPSAQKYPLLHDKTTYYVCKGHTCLPPENTLSL